MPKYEGNMDDLMEIIETSENSESSILVAKEYFYKIKIMDIVNDYIYFEEPKIKNINGSIDRPIIIYDQYFGYCLVGMHIF